MRKAFIYIRYSTAEQGQGDSMSRQLRLARSFVESASDMKLELVEDPIFLDEGVSSFKGGNLAPDKGFGRFLAAIESGEVPAGSVLLIESLDRLSRQAVVQSQRLFLDLLGRGIAIVTTSPDERRVYDGQVGVFDLIVSLTTMQRANEESVMKSRRLREAWKQKREKATHTIMTRTCPQWLSVTLDGSSFVVDEEKAAVVRHIFECAESMGYGAIARYLNARGTPAFSSRTVGWHPSSIVKIINNVAAMGSFQPNSVRHVEVDNVIRRRANPEGVPIQDYYPAVVDAALFNRVHTLKASRIRGSAGRKGETVSNLFTGIATCGACGGKMSMVDKGAAKSGANGGKSLVCSLARRGAGCKYVGWPYQPLESSFMFHCKHVDLSEVVPQKSKPDGLVSTRKRYLALEGQLQATRSTASRLLASALDNGGVLPRIVQQQLLTMEEQCDELEAKLSKEKEQLHKLELNQWEQRGFQTMFFELFTQLRSASPPERLRLRASLQRAIRYSVDGLVMHQTSDSDRSRLSEALREARARVDSWESKEGRPSFDVDPSKANRHYVVTFKSGRSKAIYLAGATVIAVELLDGESQKNALHGPITFWSP